MTERSPPLRECMITHSFRRCRCIPIRLARAEAVDLADEPHAVLADNVEHGVISLDRTILLIRNVDRYIGRVACGCCRSEGQGVFMVPPWCAAAVAQDQVLDACAFDFGSVD